MLKSQSTPASPSAGRESRTTPMKEPASGRTHRTAPFAAELVRLSWIFFLSETEGADM